ncbi:hypothetical protein LCGC14_0797790 [marine sediment metagenome]|uniref:Uncharacterized protein n=1 Tax=marine sediment metagenome TaxID=412755 RepID=A0A0F9SXS0_9ZZZZ
MVEVEIPFIPAVYEKPKNENGLPPSIAKVEPKKRSGYHLCDPYWARKEFKWLFKNKSKKVQEDFMNVIVSSCATGVGKGSHISAKMPKVKRPMNGWNCYLRWCKDQTVENEQLDFATCMKSSDKYEGSLGWKIRQEEYNGKEESWKKKATEGC